MELAENSEGDFELELTEPQTEFFLNEDKYPLFVAGFGAGKSTAFGACVLRDLSFPVKGIKIGAYAPTYDLLKLITIPYIEELLQYSKIEYSLNKSDYIFYLPDEKQIICRSMDNPSRIVGYQTFRAHIDEIDTLRKDQAADAWNKIVGRNRQQVPMLNQDGEQIFSHYDILPEQEKEFAQKNYVNIDGIVREVERGTGTHVRRNEMNRVSAYSTPEGFSFCYDRWVKNKNDGYTMIQAPTYSNPNLPADYIPSLRATYPAELISAYIEGEFVNLTSGAVYKNFDRELNYTNEEIRTGERKSQCEDLHIGVDFNVLKMSAAIFVIRNEEPFLLDEIFGEDDTPSLCVAIQDRYPNHNIYIYPDSSGKNTSSKSASQSDLTIIRQHNFKIKARNKNPLIKNRVASVNSMILNGKGERRLKINTDKCPEATECLEQQVYDTGGMPDKRMGKDHMNDAIGYFIYFNYMVEEKKVSKATVHMFGR
jgi:hypothetical protein